MNLLDLKNNNMYDLLRSDTNNRSSDIIDKSELVNFTSDILDTVVHIIDIYKSMTFMHSNWMQYKILEQKTIISKEIAGFMMTHTIDDKYRYIDFCLFTVFNRALYHIGICLDFTDVFKKLLVAYVIMCRPMTLDEFRKNYIKSQKTAISACDDDVPFQMYEKYHMLKYPQCLKRYETMIKEISPNDFYKLLCVELAENNIEIGELNLINSEYTGKKTEHSIWNMNKNPKNTNVIRNNVKKSDKYKTGRADTDFCWRIKK